jgi:hypothetical protein
MLNHSSISLTKETAILYVKKESRTKLKILIAYRNNYTELKFVNTAIQLNKVICEVNINSPFVHWIR